MSAPGTTNAAPRRAAPDNQNQRSRPKRTARRRVKQTDAERGRMKSEAFEQLERLREHPGYLACGTPAQHLVDEIVIRWCDRFGQAWPERESLCAAMTARGKRKGKDAVVDALNDLERNGVVRFPEGREGGRTTNLIQVLPANLGGRENPTPTVGENRHEPEDKGTGTVLRQAQNGSAAAADGADDAFPDPLDWSCDPAFTEAFSKATTGSSGEGDDELAPVDQLARVRELQAQRGWLPEEESA